MPDSPPAILYYVHDPMCSWCYGFAPVWRELRDGLGDSVRVVSLVGGLAPDSEEPMPPELREKLQATWRRIMQVIPGTEFNFDFWSLNIPRRSTYPACCAAIAARRMADKEEAMTRAIQSAYYREASNPSDLEVLADAAASIGLDRDEFVAQMQSAELQRVFAAELEQVRGIGVHSFPSLVLAHGGELHNVELDYLSATTMQRRIENLVDTHHA